MSLNLQWCCPESTIILLPKTSQYLLILGCTPHIYVKTWMLYDLLSMFTPTYFKLSSVFSYQSQKASFCLWVGTIWLYFLILTNIIILFSTNTIKFFSIICFTYYFSKMCSRFFESKLVFNEYFLILYMIFVIRKMLNVVKYISEKLLEKLEQSSVLFTHVIR